WSAAFDRLDMTLTGGSNRLFNLVLGNKVHDSFPLDWRDSVAFRLGHEFFATPQDVIRVGYVYHNSPIPSATVFPLLAGTLEHAVCLGYGHEFRDRCGQPSGWRFDAAYQYSWGPTNHVGFSH